jgi:serine/threonine-protein phosphatase 6 regulatory subunit 3
MFWECHVVTSSIEKLLEQPNDDIKLQDLLDENDLIQECLNQNKRLLDYLVQKNIMNELIHHVITLPNDNNFRNANIVSELLSGDFQRIQECLLEKDNLDLLYSFLTLNNQTLNPILASYFSRIINTLIIRKSNEIINYFKSQNTFQNDFLNHLDSTSITDILYHLISDSGEQRSDTIKWYEDINLIDGLIQEFLKSESKFVQQNIANLLDEFLRLAFDQSTGGIDCDFAGPALSATIERLLYNRNETNEGLILFSILFFFTIKNLYF